MIETERKFIIEMPDTDVLSVMPSYTVSDITQTYLSSKEGVTERVRRRIYQDRTEYTHTTKIRISRLSAIEEEREIDATEYGALLSKIKPGTRPIRKVRHTVCHSGLTFEIDIYPEWEHRAIMECELASENTEISFPDCITVVREVTGMKEYTNASMARQFPKE